MNKSRPVLDRYNQLIALTENRSIATEAYRTLRTNLQFAGVDREVKMILVTSTGPSEGKSTTVANLSVVLAQAGHNVLLIDADMRKPTAHHFFRATNRRGLSHLLSQQMKIEDVVQKTFIEGLHLITSGPVPPNPAEMLGSKRMKALLQNLRDTYDYVLLDALPVIAVTDAQLLAGQVDGVLLVVHSGKTNREMAAKAKDLLLNVKANLLGAVLNKQKMKRNNYYAYYYGEK